MAVSPDEKLVATGNQDGGVHLHEVATGNLVRALPRHDGPVDALAFSADGQRMLTGCHDGSVQLWEVATGKRQRAMKGAPNWVRGLAFLPGDRAVSADRDAKLRVWNLATGALEAELTGPKAGFVDVAVAANGRTAVATSDDGSVSVYDLDKRERTAVLSGHEGWSGAIGIDPLGEFAISGGQDKAVRIWNLERSQIAATLVEHEREVTSVAFVDDLRRTALTTGFDGQVLFVNLAEHKVSKRTRFEGSPPMNARVLGHGKRVLVLTEAEGLRVLDLPALGTAQGPTGHGRWIREVAFSPDGKRLASCSNDQSVRIWDLASGEEKLRYRHGGIVATAIFLPDGRFASADAGIHVWNDKAEKEAELHHPRGVTSIVALPGGRIASGCNDGMVRLWDFQGTEQPFAERHARGVNSLAVTANGALLASGGDDNVVCLWDPAARTRLGILTGHNEKVNGVAITSDARFVLSASADRTVKVWDVAAQREVRSIDVGAGADALALVPGQPRVVVAGRDGTIRIFEWTTGREVDRLSLETAADVAIWVACAPDGKRFAAGTRSGAVLVFALAP
jgi:WD40 repeat protein